RERSATPIRAHSGSSCASRMPAILILYFRDWTEARITVGYATSRFAFPAMGRSAPQLSSCVPADSRFPLYRPELERDACGIGLVVDARGRRSRDIVEQALGALVRSTHRGARQETPSIDASGILTQIPWRVYRDDLPPAFSTGTGTRALGAFF